MADPKVSTDEYLGLKDKYLSGEGLSLEEEARRQHGKQGKKYGRGRTVVGVDGKAHFVPLGMEPADFIFAGNRNYDDLTAQEYRASDAIQTQVGQNELLGPSQAAAAAQDPYAQQGTSNVYDAYRDIVQQGGITNADRARMQQGFAEAGQQDRSRREAMQNQMASRGMAGQGAEMSALLANEQATTAANAGVNRDMVIAGQQRADQALGGMGAMSAQHFGMGFQAGGAQDMNAIMTANKQTETRLKNFESQQAAQTAKDDAYNRTQDAQLDLGIKQRDETNRQVTERVGQENKRRDNEITKQRE